MQQKARMTFRFEPAKPSKPAASPSEAVPDKRVLGTEETRTATGCSDFDVDGPLLDDPAALEEIIRRAEPAPFRTRPPQTDAREPGFPAKPEHSKNPEFGKQPEFGKIPEYGKTLEFGMNSEFAKNAEFVKNPEFGKIPESANHPEIRTKRDPLLAETQGEEDIEAGGWPILDESLYRGHKSAGKFAGGEGPSWWKVFASVAGAIGTGALFGYLVLTLFTGETPFPASASQGSDQPAQAQAESAAASSPSVPPSSPQGSSTAREWPAETYYVLQYGVFQSEEGAAAALEELKGKGYPGFEDRSDGFRVYAGVAGTKEEAELLASQMQGVEIFVKPLAVDSWVPAVSEGAEQLGAFIGLSHELTRELASLSVFALQDENPQPIDADKLAKLREIHGKWLEAAGRLDGKAQEKGKAIVQALNAAIVSVEDYGRNHSRFHLWRVQADAMQAVAADRSLRTSAASGQGG
ncbi:hypothetical protein GE107_17520 [Cohnella sp. CFH 77786]|uniref:SPOR domain-containing protein n=1 Tax=Cohnella sp. CFH 77786 TaxID=2662265 RepID=UPI001C60F7BE|nr:SPOR domain-containing protein [Cohnella sp. CFH 77786]MBW5447856.1 hypothetical protein [Cohnella sp. CFH 77786]